MAKKKIGHDQIFESKLVEKAIAEFTALLKITDKVEESFKDILKIQQKALKRSKPTDLKGYKEQTAAIKAVANAEKALIGVEINRAKLLKQKQDFEIKARKEQERKIKTTNKAKKATFEEAVAIEKSKIKLRDYNRKIRESARLQLKGSKSTNKWGKALGSFAFKFNFLGNAISSVSGIISRGFSRALRGTLSIINNYSKANSDLSAVLGVQKEDIKDLIKDSQRLGKSTKFTATQVSQLQKEFAKLGFEKKSIIGMSKATLDLAAATDSELAEAARVMGSTLNAFGLQAKDSTHTVDVMAKSFSSSALDLENFSETMKNAAPIARVTGVSLELATAAAGKLADANIRGSKAGTDLKKIFSELVKDGKPLQESLNDIAKEIDNAETKAEKLAIAEELVGDRAKGALLILVDQKDALGELSTALVQADGDAKRMAETMQDNLTGDMEKLTSAWEGFVLSIEEGDGIISKSFRSMSQGLTEFFGTMTDEATTAREKFIQFTQVISGGPITDFGKETRLLRDHLDSLSGAINKNLLSAEQLEAKYKELSRALIDQDLTTQAGRVNALLYKDSLLEILEALSPTTAAIIETTEAVEELSKEEIKAIEKRNKALEKARIAKLETSVNLQRENASIRQQEAEEDEEILNEIVAIIDKENKAKYDQVEKEAEIEATRTEQTKLGAERRAAAEKEANEKRIKDALQTAQIIADAINDVWQEQFDKKQALLDKEIEQSKKHQEELKGLAQKGVENAADTLAFEQKKQAELELQKAEQEKKLQQAQLAMEFIKVYASYAEDDPKTALTNTIKDIVVIKQAVKGLSSLDEGIENTNDANQDAKANDGKNGFYAILHPEERVIDPHNNAMLKGISNDKLAELGREHKEGGKWETNEQILKKFDSLENAVKDIQKPDFKYDKWANMITSIIKTRNTKISTHQKVGGLFSN